MEPPSRTSPRDCLNADLPVLAPGPRRLGDAGSPRVRCWRRCCPELGSRWTFRSQMATATAQRIVGDMPASSTEAAMVAVAPSDRLSCSNSSALPRSRDDRESTTTGADHPLPNREIPMTPPLAAADRSRCVTPVPTPISASTHRIVGGFRSVSPLGTGVAGVETEPGSSRFIRLEDSQPSDEQSARLRGPWPNAMVRQRPAAERGSRPSRSCAAPASKAGSSLVACQIRRLDLFGYRREEFIPEVTEWAAGSQLSAHRRRFRCGL